MGRNAIDRPMPDLTHTKKECDMSQKLTPDDAQSIIARASNPYALNTTLKPVDLAVVRETLNPQGRKIKAEDLIDTTFTIVEVHPYESAFEGGQPTVYWCKCVDEAGELFNTTLGGQKLVQALGDVCALNAAAFTAAQMGDDAEVAKLEELGANRPLKVTLRQVHGGKFGRYYDFE
jgi:hypothetical protein